MAFGRNFQESLQKAMRGLEIGVSGFDEKVDTNSLSKYDFTKELRFPGGERLWYIADAMRAGMSTREIAQLTGIDPWFLAYIEDLIAEEQRVRTEGLELLDASRIRALKRKGFSDSRLALLLRCGEHEIRGRRQAANVRPVFKRVTPPRCFRRSPFSCLKRRCSIGQRSLYLESR